MGAFLGVFALLCIVPRTLAPQILDGNYLGGTELCSLQSCEWTEQVGSAQEVCEKGSSRLCPSWSTVFFFA